MIRPPGGGAERPRRRASFALFVGGVFAHLALAAALVASVAAALARNAPDHWNPWAPLALDAPWTPVQDLKVAWAMDDAALCLDAVLGVGGSTSMPDLVETPTCGVRARVSVARLEEARLEPMETSCRLALTLFLWEREVLQPAAREVFGAGAARIHHFGSYSCRTIAGSARMSRHATGDAVDISAFTLADGRRISVKDGWRGDADARRFLRLIRDGACDRFDVVLSPDYNADHDDHLHMDVGRWGFCG